MFILRVLLIRLLPVLVLGLVLLRDARPQDRSRLVDDPETPLSADQTADVLGLTSVLQLLHQPDRPDTTKLLVAQQQILLTVTAASLQVDAATGQIDEEIAETHELQNYLTAKRARQIDLLNLASLAIGGTLGTTSAALGLTPHLKASGVIGITAGSSITALSLIGLHVRKGGKDVLEARSNMLSRVFDLNSDPNNYYPPVVATFMERAAPNDPSSVTRKQHLIQAWEKLGRLPPVTTEKGKQKMARLASVPIQDTKLSIGDLDDRQAMLYDLRARIMYLKRDLAVLITAAAQSTP